MRDIPPKIVHARQPKERLEPLQRDIYLKVVYSEERRPPGDYGNKLALHLRDTYFGEKGRILDIGCGRGDMLRGFGAAGYEAFGVDISPNVRESEPFETRVADLKMNRYRMRRTLRFRFLQIRYRAYAPTDAALRDSLRRIVAGRDGSFYDSKLASPSLGAVLSRLYSCLAIHGAFADRCYEIRWF